MLKEKLGEAELFRLRSLADLTSKKDEEIAQIRSALRLEQAQKLAELKSEMEEQQESRIRELRAVWKQVRKSAIFL